MRLSNVISILFIFFVFQPDIHAQELKEEKLIEPGFAEWEKFIEGNEYQVYKMRSGNYLGTPFLYQDFKRGSVIFSNHGKISDVPLNYNISTAEVVYQKGGKTYLMFTDYVLSFTVSDTSSDKIRTFSREFIPHAKRSEFIEILTEGKVILYKRRIKEMLETEKNSHYSSPGPLDEYTDRKQFLVKQDNEIKLLRQRKKPTLELFGDHTTGISQYIKKEKIKLHREEDLIKLVDYYNGLQ